MQELVTENVATQIVVERDYDTILWGTNHFLAYGVVELLVGINLADLRITQVGDSFIVDLPSPEIFKATLDENSVRVTRDATFLMRLSDLDAAAKQNDIRIQMLEAGKAFNKDRGLLPTRNENIRRIREMLSVSSVDTSHLLFTVPNS